MSEPAEDLTCRELVEVITDYFDGAMSPDEHARFERHLRDCTGCQAVISQFRTMVEVTGHLTEEQISEEQREAMRVVFRGWREAAPSGAE